MFPVFLADICSAFDNRCDIRYPEKSPIEEVGTLFLVRRDVCGAARSFYLARSGYKKITENSRNGNFTVITGCL